MTAAAHPLRNDLFLRACRREQVERTPVWIMRQAGRYLPEYRELRAKVDFLTSCRTPEIATELTLQPVRRLGVDAAILFSDILIPLPGMGVPVEFDPGPKIAAPIRSRSAIDVLRAPDAREATPFVLEAVRMIRRELAGEVPLIGFAGAPFTVATYLVEGGGSKSFSAIKALLFSDPPAAHKLLAVCAEAIGSYLAEQVRAGAQAAMLFDTWAGILAPADYRTYALPYARRVFERVAEAGSEHPTSSGAAREDATRRSASEAQGDAAKTARTAAGAIPSAPRIYYAGEAAGWLEAAAETGAEVIGIDWRIGIDAARRRLGSGIALQGNLDPAVLLGPTSLIEERTRAVLLQAKDVSAAPGAAAGHIFNLGHGILPETPPEHALFLVQTVRRLTTSPDR